MKTQTKKIMVLLVAVIISYQPSLKIAKAQSVPPISPFVDSSVESQEIPEYVSETKNYSQTTNTSYPFTKTFLISAYYSPLPGQQKYATGSYEKDIRLNGGGVHGADGTTVYPGMIAAPSSYPFGTKMKITGIGVVAVHDRGGAIVHSGERANVYDRLDVWMGYGDAGLKRALGWGKRQVEVTVYGVDKSISENVELVGYSENEKYVVSKTPAVEEVKPRILFEKPDEPPLQLEKKAPTSQKNFTTILQLGDNGTNVTKLQKELKRINLLGIEPTGYYGEVTAHAVFKFQQKHGLVSDENAEGAGVFGPKTQNLLNNLVAERETIQEMMKEE